MDNFNKNKKNRPPAPERTKSQLLSSWSVTLGIMGVLADCFCCMMLNLPAGIFFGIAGIVTAILSREDQKFNRQARTGLILSIIAVSLGVFLFMIMVTALNLLKTDPEIAALYNQMYQTYLNYVNEYMAK